MRLDARELGRKSPNGKNGGAPHAYGIGTLSSEIKEKLKNLWCFLNPYFQKLLNIRSRIETCPIYPCDTYIFPSNFETISLSQNSLNRFDSIDPRGSTIKSRINV